jgi:hypothetical protein
MKGNGLVNIIGDNLSAVNPYLASQNKSARHWWMCWKCQKEKPTAGGSIKMMSGNTSGTLARFICKECVEAKQAQLKEQT